MLYTSLPVWKLHLHGDIASQPYKPIFYSSHLLATHLAIVVHSSKYSVFYNGDTPN